MTYCIRCKTKNYRRVVGCCRYCGYLNMNDTLGSATKGGEDK